MVLFTVAHSIGKALFPTTYRCYVGNLNEADVFNHGQKVS